MAFPEAVTDGFNWQRAGKLFAVAVFLVVLGVFVTAAVPQTVGADESYVVLSDSMSPAIGAGSMVYVATVPTDQIEESDVITFRSESSTEPVTHRVVEVVERDGERQFRTKGDANEEADREVVEAAQVVGRVTFHVPLVGYAVSFAGSDLGIALLVVVPAVLLAVTELRDLYGSTGSGESEQDQGGETE